MKITQSTLSRLFAATFRIPSYVDACREDNRKVTARDIWANDGLLAEYKGLLLVDRSVLRPDVPAKNIRKRFQIIVNNDNQDLVATFRSLREAERYLFSSL